MALTQCMSSHHEALQKQIHSCVCVEVMSCFSFHSLEQSSYTLLFPCKESQLNAPFPIVKQSVLQDGHQEPGNTSWSSITVFITVQKNPPRPNIFI